jgi:septum formation protein
MERPIWLASRSPRRKQLLEQSGMQAHELRIMPADIDDARLAPGHAVTPSQWVMALAYLKARRVKELIDAGSRAGTIIGADTVCVAPNADGEILGQPRDLAHARRMLELLRNATHQTITGICLLDFHTSDRLLFCDRAIVRIADVTDHQLETYLASGLWTGKAGAYNLSERIEAGWPIEVEGDLSTVMGLPMRRLKRDFGF